MSLNVLYSPPYFSAVMHKCCIGTSEVSRLMCSTRLIGDGCFNNFVDKKHFITINTFLCSFGHMGLHRNTELHENCCFILLNHHDSVQ